MNEELHKWKNAEHIAQYIEQVRLDLSQDNQASLVVKSIKLDGNYGFILLTKDRLSLEDHEKLKAYVISQLKEFGYRVNRTSEGEVLLQASVKERVKGNQLFGTTKIMDKGYELRILVSPYNDRSYEGKVGRGELIGLLFS